MWFADTLMLPPKQAAHKAAAMRVLTGPLQATITAAYGGDRDVDVFAAAGVPRDRLYVAGARAKVDRATAVPCTCQCGRTDCTLTPPPNQCSV